MSDHDTIVNIESNSFKVLARKQNDKVDQQDVFKTDSIIFMDESYGFPPYYIYKQDTVIRKHLIYYNDCNTFPLNDVNYLAIRIINVNEIKLGWIKLSIIDNNKIILFETAIQK